MSFIDFNSAFNELVSGGTANILSVSENFTKVSHGLSVGDVVKHDGPNPEDFSKAQTNLPENSQAVGVVSIVNGDKFTVVYLGKISGLSGLTTGVNFLSDSIAGGLTSTEPNISKPIIFATSSTEGIVMLERGMDGSPAEQKTVRVGHTWAISSEVKVPSGNTDFLMPFFVSLAGGQTAKVVKARYVLNSGTSATVKLQKNGVDVTGFVAMSVTTTPTSTDPADVSLADDDKLALVVTGVSGTPTNMTFTLFIEYTV